ncbi:aminotransferase class I/II-fold pyridoxal phosphate-dependent enzyme [Clostridium sp. DJ247]|uniref:aminotransferase class I/II-fold pyridoxal phosphate-dependent enzyme n=1 Tax=Clostridium sp. DJ247 TaxID=2726188 RepID=UPI00162AA34C|nr:aminotransferase class V-fold PLP-dependent enzyme [Clostridium sp. DJ247]MBC2581243.1 aminotransferase class V-fold PLP-dependent enzyme [Clostridium sp. DJ247]
MSELPLVEGVLRYIKENNISFYMPGHKGGNGFMSTPVGREFIENFLKCDITEVDGVDNLHNPEGIIKDAVHMLTSFYKSKKSYFLVNGSTSGNMIMIFSSFNEGDKILVERNCHRSIFNAIIMRKLKPVYIKNKISERLNAPLSLDLEHFSQVINNNKDAKGIIITYPNYYGVCSNLQYIIDKCKKLGVKVLVDSAHGSHFGIQDDLPKSAVKLGADMIVTSAHKTLCSLTQTSYLHVNNGQDIGVVDFYFSAFSSTSPSYLFLCAMDYARFYLENYGREQYEKLLGIANHYRNKINRLHGIHVIGKEDISRFNEEVYNSNENSINKLDYVSNIDISRYVLNLDKKYSGHLLEKYLRNNGIQVEMSDSSNVVMIFSPFNETWEFKKLYDCLKKCDLTNIKSENIKPIQSEIPKTGLLPFEVVNNEKEHVDLDKSLGRISADSIVPYPPGIPIVTMGEIIDKNCLESIHYYKTSGVDILGIDKQQIKVVKKL